MEEQIAEIVKEDKMMLNKIQLVTRTSTCRKVVQDLLKYQETISVQFKSIHQEISG